MASLLLETEDGRPGFWRELGAAVISPPTGLNRLAFGNRFDAIYPSNRPATLLRLQVGGTLTSSSQNVSSSVKPHGAVGDFTFTYGLPGKPGYGYARPFDYFDFHVTAVTANALESLNMRGLLFGRTYESGDSTRGIWGLFGSYDYISPQVFACPAPPSRSGQPGNRGWRRRWRSRERLWLAPAMARLAASSALRSGIITMGLLLKAYSRSV